MSEDIVSDCDKCLTLQELHGNGNRRREKRHSASRRVRVYCIDDKFRDATLSDCSPQGVCILLAEPIQTDAQFMIQLKADPIQMAAYTVRYWWRTKEGDYRIGAELAGVIGAPDEQEPGIALRSLLDRARDLPE